MKNSDHARCVPAALDIAERWRTLDLAAPVRQRETPEWRGRVFDEETGQPATRAKLNTNVGKLACAISQRHEFVSTTLKGPKRFAGSLLLQLRGAGKNVWQKP